MAGAGYKLFNTGDVLTAAQVNTYLQEQAVMVFADSAARTTALSGVLAEGMITYLKSDDKVYKYTGSAWVEVGGGSSPLTTKGDLYGFSTVDARIPIGSNGQVLTADSTQTLGLKWATPASGGKVLQVVSSTTTTQTNIASTTLTDTGITASITPAATSSKILVLVSASSFVTRSSSEAAAGAELLRGSTVIADYNLAQSIEWQEIFSQGSAEIYNLVSNSIVYLDSPSTTSSTTYKVQARAATTANSGQVRFQYNGAPSTITLLEIGA